MGFFLRDFGRSRSQVSLAKNLVHGGQSAWHRSIATREKHFRVLIFGDRGRRFLWRKILCTGGRALGIVPLRHAKKHFRVMIFGDRGRRFLWRKILCTRGRAFDIIPFLPLWSRLPKMKIRKKKLIQNILYGFFFA